MFMIIGASLAGAAGASDHEFQRMRRKLQMDDAWRQWHREHDVHTLTEEEQVHIDQLMEEGSAPPGWTWVDSTLFPPGKTLSVGDGVIVQAFDPEIVLFSDNDGPEALFELDNRESTSLTNHPRRFKILAHTDPEPAPEYPLTPFRLVPGHNSIHDHLETLKRAGLELAENFQGALIVSRGIDQRDDPWWRSVLDALKAGYLLARSPSFPRSYFVLHPLPGRVNEDLPIDGPYFQVRERDLRDTLARQRFRLGFTMKPPPWIR